MVLPKHVIYIVAHAENAPGNYVVHRLQVGEFGSEELHFNFIVNKTLSEIRKEMRAKKLICEDRVMGEDPKIVEKWI